MSKLKQIVERLDKNNPLDAAVVGCVTTIFHSISQTAEFTQKTLMSFDPSSNVKPSDMKKWTDHNGLEVTSFSLPRQSALTSLRMHTGRDSLGPLIQRKILITTLLSTTLHPTDLCLHINMGTDTKPSHAKFSWTDSMTLLSCWG